MRIRALLLACQVAVSLAALRPALADSAPLELSIKNQAFSPATLTIPADTRVEIRIHNQDALPAEFESYDFNREKVVPGGSKVVLYVGPLKPGTYQFFNDFHPASTGKLIVKPQAQE